MFGVNLKLKTPFYSAMIGSALGSAYSVFTNVLNVSPGPTDYRFCNNKTSKYSKLLYLAWNSFCGYIYINISFI